eukprot:TRINITY_DN59280_c0_g1_i1.p1 TRINITY_DN59280_c0_g1~~TRINITY_DN59280_c0_g1_i1.p1  ORF type:complete len:711 (-),score=77.29 TRINITY_DN59280_c0_g1_i1:1563-3695(-)
MSLPTEINGAFLHTILTKIIAAVQELDGRTAATEKDIKGVKSQCSLNKGLSESLEERILDHAKRLNEVEDASTKLKVDSEKLVELEEEVTVVENRMRKSLADLKDVKEKQVELEEAMVGVRCELQEADVEIHGLQDNHQHLQEEQAVLTKKISSLKNQSDSLDRQIKQTDREVKHSLKENSDTVSRKEITRLEELVDALKKKRETDYRSLSHRLDQVASPNMDNDVKGLKKVMGELEGKYKSLHVASDKINRFDEQLKAFIKRHETDIVAVNMRIEDSQQQKPEDVVKGVTKRFERDVVELRRKIDMVIGNVASFKDELNAEVGKQRDQVKVFSAKQDSKLREIVAKAQDLVTRMDEVEKRDASVIDHGDIAAKYDRLRHKVDSNFKSMAQNVADTGARIESLELRVDTEKQRHETSLREIDRRTSELKAIVARNHQTQVTSERGAYDDSALRGMVHQIESQVAEQQQRTVSTIEDINEVRREVRHTTQIAVDAQESVRKLENEVRQGEISRASLASTPSVVDSYPPPRPPMSVSQDTPAVGINATSTTLSTSLSSSIAPTSHQTVPTALPPQQLANANPYERPHIGVEVVEAKHRHTGETSVYCKHITPGGTFDQAGVISGDIILHWNDQQITTKAEFGQCVESCIVGEPLKLGVLRTQSTPSADGNPVQQIRYCKGHVQGISAPGAAPPMHQYPATPTAPAGMITASA